MQGIATTRRQIAVHGNQILHIRHLARQNNLVFRQPQIHRFLRRLQRRHNQRFFHHFFGRFRRGGGKVFVHHFFGEALVERTPVHADAHGFVVFGGGANHVGKFFIAFHALAHVTRIDAVFGQRAGAIGKLRQQAFAVEVEIANQRHGAAHVVQPLADFGNLAGGFGRVHGNPHHFRAGICQLFHLLRGGGGIGGVGVGHGLDNNGVV